MIGNFSYGPEKPFYHGTNSQSQNLSPSAHKGFMAVQGLNITLKETVYIVYKQGEYAQKINQTKVDKIVNDIEQKRDSR